jgi:glycosyltransferase involved in cell wall biosynthesis
MNKVCFFINSDWYFKLHWLERAQAAFVAGYEVHVISNFKDNNILELLEQEGFICHNSKMDELSINPLQFINCGIRIFQIVKKIRPNIIHCITIKPCLIGGMISRKLKIPVIFSVVGLGRIFTETTLFYRFLYYMITGLYRHSLGNPLSHILFEHENDKKQFVSIMKVDPAKCTVIDGAGVETERFCFVPEQQHSVKKVLFAGRLLWSKGLGDLITIKKTLLRQGEYFELIVAGIPIPNDPDAINDEQMRLWQSQKDIIWVGQSNDMHHLIADSNVVALPTNYPEGIPRILLEAASTGRATICYDSGGCNKLLVDGETGFLVKKKDLHAFSDKLSLLLNNDDIRAEMGSKARALVEEKFSSKIVKSKTLDLYRKLIK